jgi:Chalcone isomerase-like
MIRIQRSLATILIAACAMFYWAGNAFALKKASEQPAEVVQSIANARNVGAARLKVWGFEVYDARLWAEPEFNADSYLRNSFALEIHYLRSFDNNAVADRSLKEMRGIGEMNETQAQQWLAQMRSIFPDIAQGDRLVGLHKPGVGASFVFNGKSVGEIRDPEFARLFFGIWLSPKTSHPKMRRELLGQSTSGKRTP